MEDCLNENNFFSYDNVKYDNLSLNVKLNDIENKIFSLFKEIIKENNLLSIELRVTGGWVRDKLLNFENNDIDIVISNYSSFEFSKLIQKKIQNIKIISTNIKQVYGNKINLVKLNIFEQNIDLININNNPIEDANKRDLTINSLFYNIIQNKIEDFTNKGINDLKNGILRTPLNPYFVYSENPLCIIKLLRFAEKYKFKIDNTINEDILLNKEEYKKNIKEKRSNDKIFIEISKVFILSKPYFVIYGLFKYNILESVLHIDKFKNMKNGYCECDIIKLVNLFIIGNFIFEKYSNIFLNEIIDNEYKIIYYSFLLIVIFNEYKDECQVSLSKIISQKILKIQHKEKNIYKLLSYFNEFISLVSSDNYNRISVGILIRNILGNNISKMILSCISLEYINLFCEKNKIINNINEEKCEILFQKYNKLYNYGKNENLLNIDELKPILSNKEIILNYKNIKGNMINKIILFLISKQIESYNKINKEDALLLIDNYIKNNYSL